MWASQGLAVLSISVTATSKAPHKRYPRWAFPSSNSIKWVKRIFLILYMGKTDVLEGLVIFPECVNGGGKVSVLRLAASFPAKQALNLHQSQL